MRNKYFIIIVVLLSALFLFNCSDVEDEISQPPVLDGVHDTPTSAEIHGKLMAENGLADCKKCHDANFTGGTAQVSCTECHPSIGVHQAGIVSPSSPEFHAKFLADNKLEMSECKTCHGIEYEGGVSSPTCSTCHTGISVHKVGIVSPSSPDFHGKFLADNDLEMAECKTCHGIEYEGGVTSPTCTTCHTGISVHKVGIVSPSSPEFHGKFLADNELEMSECKTCHGIDYEGGLSSPGCTTCHTGISVHKAGIISPSSPDFHGKYIMDMNWDLAECSTCHGEDYSGGLVSNSCNTCHSGTNGPESCNTCHGDFSDESKIAPPRDLSGNMQTSARGVGAHSSHLYENMLGADISCYECHPTVENTDNYVSAHIDGLPAEMKFGTIASSGLSTPSYNSDLSCANTYCHGNFAFSKSQSENKYAYTNSEIVGNNFKPIWNIVDGTQAACGTCHGELDESGNLITAQPLGHFSPSEGTFSLDQCPICHSAAFNADGSLNKLVHINGEKNLDN